MIRFYTSFTFIGFVLFFLALLCLSISVLTDSVSITFCVISLWNGVLMFVIGIVGRSLCEVRQKVRKLEQDDLIRTARKP